jgi:hypothetical protein
MFNLSGLFPIILVDEVDRKPNSRFIDILFDAEEPAVTAEIYIDEDIQTPIPDSLHFINCNIGKTKEKYSLAVYRVCPIENNSATVFPGM